MANERLSHALRNLRHLYEQMIVPGQVTDTKSAAKGLLGPAIEEIEAYQTSKTWNRNESDGG